MKKSYLTPRQRILDGLSILICLGTVIYLLIQYKSLPEQVASHFDAAGNITAYQGKSMLFVLAFFMVFLITLPLSVLVRIRKLYTIINTPWPIPKGQEERIAELTKDFLMIMNLMMTILFAYLILCCMHSWKPGILLWLPIAYSFVALLLFFLRTRRISKNPRDKDPWET